MKLISIIAGAALLMGCSTVEVGDRCYDETNLLFTNKYCNGYQVYYLPGRFEKCMSNHLTKTTFDGLTCVPIGGWGLYAVSVKNKEADIAKLTEELMKRRDEQILAERKAEAEKDARLKKALKGKEKCMASFAKAIGIADDAHQVLRNDIFFEAKSIAYVQVAQEIIASEIPDLGLSYPQLQSVGYRNSEEFTEWRKATSQRCSQALYYSQCMSANYLLELKDAEDELIKNCKRR